jgi:hypothetical protein
MDRCGPAPITRFSSPKDFRIHFNTARTPNGSCRFAFKAQVTIPPGASIQKVATKGNDLAVIVTSALPIPVTILELYARNLQQQTLETIKGSEAAKAFLLRSGTTKA